jgi:hypothetical protein
MGDGGGDHFVDIGKMVYGTIICLLDICAAKVHRKNSRR